jgi:hypothetical protein
LVFLEPAVAHLGKAEHPLDDPDRMFDLGPHLRFGPVPGPLDRVDDATVSIAAVGEIPRPRRFPADHGALAAIGLIAPDAGFLAMQQFGEMFGLESGTASPSIGSANIRAFRSPPMRKARATARPSAAVGTAN